MAIKTQTLTISIAYDTEHYDEPYMWDWNELIGNTNCMPYAIFPGPVEAASQDVLDEWETHQIHFG